VRDLAGAVLADEHVGHRFTIEQLTIAREVQIDLEVTDRGDSALPTLRERAAWRLINCQKRLLSQPGNCIKPQRRELGAIANR
jgi:hypothetical protein